MFNQVSYNYRMQSLGSEATFMLDTVIFNRVLEGVVDVAVFRAVNILATAVQREELNATRNENVRKELAQIFRDIGPINIPAFFAFDIPGAGLDEGVWASTADAKQHSEMLIALSAADKKRGRKKKPANQTKDILIAQAAMKSGATLITDDGGLRNVVALFGGSAISLQQFMMRVEPKITNFIP
jgi:hypothetical protein